MITIFTLGYGGLLRLGGVTDMSGEPLSGAVITVTDAPRPTARPRPYRLNGDYAATGFDDGLLFVMPAPSVGDQLSKAAMLVLPHR